MSCRPIAGFTAALVTVLALVVLPSASAHAGEPYQTLGLPPAGANDWGCKPTPDRPFPAVIVHGTFGDQKSLLDALSLSLKRDAFCVFAIDYGNRATGPIEESAAQLDSFVGEVLAATGANKVEVVGHSQGGMMPRYYIKNLGGAALVEDLVGLASSNHGTEAAGSFGFGDWCYSCDQQAAGSEFLAALNAGDETPGDVDYTQVVTKYDRVVVPYTSGFLPEDPQSTNVVLQESCALDTADHLTIPMDRLAIAWTLNAFTREGPADPGPPITCL